MGDKGQKKTQDYVGGGGTVALEDAQRKQRQDENEGERQDKERLMVLLHKYNDIKDATQRVLGALAVHEGVTVREMHRRYNLPLDS